MYDNKNNNNSNELKEKKNINILNKYDANGYENGVRLKEGNKKQKGLSKIKHP
jgi:hypothetical protein